MDLKKVIEIIYKFIYLSRKDIKEGEIKPGTSYILTHSLSFPGTKVLLEQFPIIDIFKIVHMVYRMFEGESIDEVIKNPLNVFYVKLIVIKESKNVYYDCSTCDGAGWVTCHDCDGEGWVTCHNCDGKGCDYCEEYGTESCGVCFGDKEISCLDCSGDGKLESDELEYRTETEYWIASNSSLYQELKNMVGDYADDVDKIYGIMERYKGDVNLLRIDYEIVNENEITNSVGYDIREGEYFIEDVDFLKDNQKLLDSMKIKYYGGGWSIR